MEAKEPGAMYYTAPALNHIRQTIINGIGRETDMNRLEQLYARYSPSGKTFEEEVAEMRAWAEQHFEPEDVEELAKVDFTVGHDPEEWNWYPPTSEDGWEREMARWEEEEKGDAGISFDDFKQRYSKLLQV